MGVLGDGCEHRWQRAGAGMVRCARCEDLVSRTHEPARFAGALAPTLDGPVDVLYVVRAGEDNPWLRYSLRTLANFPHRHVWIAGYRPSWVADTVGYIPTVQTATKYENSTRNLAAAVAHSGLAERFVFANDDMFILRPIDEIPALHRGLLDPTRSIYTANRLHRLHRAMRATIDLLQGVGCDGDLYNYELHVPMMMERQRVAEVLDLVRLPGGATVPRFTRTRYGNYWATGGEQVADCKVRRQYGQAVDTSGPFLSTSPQSWLGGAGQYIRSTFRETCAYERVRRATNTTVGRLVMRPYQPQAVTGRVAT
jgi:hypothetical protein